MAGDPKSLMQGAPILEQKNSETYRECTHLFTDAIFDQGMSVDNALVYLIDHISAGDQSAVDEFFSDIVALDLTPATLFEIQQKGVKKFDSVIDGDADQIRKFFNDKNSRKSFNRDALILEQLQSGAKSAGKFNASLATSYALRLLYNKLNSSVADENLAREMRVLYGIDEDKILSTVKPEIQGPLKKLEPPVEKIEEAPAVVNLPPPPQEPVVEVAESIESITNRRADELVIDWMRRVKSNVQQFISNVVPSLILARARRDEILSDAYQESHEPDEYIEDLIKIWASDVLLSELEKKGSRKILEKINRALEVDVSEPAAEAPLDLTNVADKLFQGHDAGERFEQIKKPISSEQIPREGGLMEMEVVVDTNGAMHAPDLAIFKPMMVERAGVKTMEIKDSGVVARFGFSHGSVEQIPAGTYTFIFKVAAKKRVDKTESITLERPHQMFENRDRIRPVGFVPQTGLYILPNGDLFGIPFNSFRFVDTSTGYAVNADGVSTNEFPFVEMQGIKKPSDFELEAGTPIYFGHVIGPEEFAYRKKMEAAFSHYYRKTTRGRYDHAPYSFGLLERDREQARAAIRNESQKNPLDVVVSSTGRMMRTGFTDFARALDGLENSGADKKLITELRGLQNQAYSAFDAFENQSKRKNNKPKDDSAGTWDGYVAFFHRIHDADVCALFDRADVRQIFFPSDLDGETAIEFYKMAGIQLAVVPFTPDQTRGDRAYIEEAIHIDISHGRGEEIVGSTRANGDPWNGVTIFLDENDEDILCASEATFRHLEQLGFLRNNQFTSYLRQLISEDDSYAGAYKTEKGCRDIIANHHKNIFGLGKEFINQGLYSVVIDFLNSELPRIENEVRQRDGDIKNDDDLRSRVLDELITYDVRDFFHAREPQLLDVNGKDLSRDLQIKAEQSYDAVRNLEARGFVGVSRFGKTLFDPFNSVKHRGLGAFALGYDCYVGYNAHHRTAIVNLAPFSGASGAEQVIPDNLYRDTDSGEPIGSVIKGGRYLVINASCRTFKNFNHVVTATMQDGDAQFEFPDGVKEYVAAEQKGKQGTDALYFKVVPEFVRTGMGKRFVEEAQESIEQNDQGGQDDSSRKEADLREAQRVFTESIGVLLTKQEKRLGDDGKALRARVASAFEQMLAGSVSDLDKETVRRAHAEILQDVSETIMRVAAVFTGPGRERVLQKYGNFRPDVFLEKYFELVMESSGLNAYKNILSKLELDSVRTQWMEKTREAWDRTFAQ